MRAWVIEAFDTPLKLLEVERPAPADKDVLIRVAATGLTFADLLMMKGTYQETPDLPFTPGLEVAGTIATVGENVRGFEPGQRVAAFAGRGGLAEYVVVNASRCLPLTGTMDDVKAAGFQIAYGTSHLALTRRARLQPGETLAVLGAAGGVGLTAVEIGKALSARVIAVARGRDRLAIAGAAGADVLIDSETTDDMRRALKEAGPLDVIYDAVGGPTGEAALRATAPEARYLIIGFASGDLPRLRPNHLLVKNTDVIGVYWGGYLNFAPDVLRDSLTELVAWHDAGRIKPHVSHTFPLAEADAALDLLQSRKATGKIVITP